LSICFLVLDYPQNILWDFARIVLFSKKVSEKRIFLTIWKVK